MKTARTRRAAAPVAKAAGMNAGQLGALVQAIGFDSPAIDYKRHDLRVPKLPFERPRDAMAMDDAGNPGNFNFLNGAGGAAAFGLYFPGYPWLSELCQRSEYRQPTETLAREMTRKWITFKSKGKGDKSERIRKIQDEFKRFNVQQIFRKAAVHDGFFGLGHVFIDIRGQAEQMDLPLQITPQTIEVGSLRGFTNCEPMWVTPLMWNSDDPTRPDFYVPDSWMLLKKRVHASRVMPFISRPVPDIIKPAYNFGGISLSQLIEPYVTRWLTTVGSVNRLISNFSIINLGADLSSILAGAGPGSPEYENFVARMKFFTQERNNQGVFLTDKERELLTQLSVPISGLSELQAQAQEHMAAPTHLPLVVLTGITPAGLNASSEGEIEVYHDFVHGMQEELFGDHLDKVLKIIQLNMDGTIDEDIVYEFVPLKELDGEAAARNRKMAADAAVAYVGAGITSPEEERERIALDPDSGYVTLDPAQVPEPPDLDADDGEEGGEDD